jgi:hypothetical protein
MKRNGLYILARVAKRGEVPLDEAIQMAHGRGGDHRDQYPLALLLEAHYLGMTINYSPPEGAELMREYALAITLHMYLRPPEAEGGHTLHGCHDDRRARSEEREGVSHRERGALPRRVSANALGPNLVGRSRIRYRPPCRCLCGVGKEPIQVVILKLIRLDS